VNRFWLWLGALAALGFAARYGVVALDAPGPYGDSFFYRGVAQELAAGRGYVDPIASVAGESQPTALHPPLFAFYLAVWAKLGTDSFGGFQIAACVLGAITVVLIGILGRRVAGQTAGLFAAGIAALYPCLAVIDSTVNSESLYVPLVVLVLIAAYRFIDSPGPVPAAVLGAVIGLATLTRPDGLLLLLVLAVPVTWRYGVRGSRGVAIAVCVAGVAVLLTPWLVRNLVAMDRFPLISSNNGYTLVATNCRATYYPASSIGFVVHDCVGDSQCDERLPELELSDCRQRKGSEYARDHLGRVPLVVLARVARVWELYKPQQNIDYGEFLWARPPGVSRAGLYAFAALALLAVGGVVVLARNGQPLVPLLSTFVAASVVAATAFGFTRFRLVAEPALVVLAATALARIARRA
jgi:4-amino-4-deoxy-L-arabinose transferase-like glycosyltransferase